MFLELANANTRQRAVAFANRFGMLDGMPDPPIEDFFFRIQRSFAAALQGPESTATITAVAEILKSRMGRRSLPSLGPLRTELRITKEKKAEIRFFASSLLQFALIQLVNSHAGLDNIRQCAAPSCGRFFNAKGVTKKRTYCRDAHKSARYRHANPDRVEASKQKKRLARSLARSSRGIAKNKIRNEIEPSRKRTAKQSTRRG